MSPDDENTHTHLTIAVSFDSHIMPKLQAAVPAGAPPNALLRVRLPDGNEGTFILCVYTFLCI